MSGKLHVIDTGEGSPVLVLLHGFGGSHRVWDGVRAALDVNARVLAYDLPGHAGSLCAPEAEKASSAAVAVLSDLHLRGIEDFHVAGHSYGGAIAALMALAHPGRVNSLTLIAPGGIGPEINAALLREYAIAITREQVAHCLSAMTGGLEPLSEKMLDDAMVMRVLPGQMDALGRLCASITRDGRQGVIPREKLASLPMPVRVAWGGRDGVLPVRQVKELPAAFLPHIFPDLGHMLPEEAPEEVAQLLSCSLA